MKDIIHVPSLIISFQVFGAQHELLHQWVDMDLTGDESTWGISGYCGDAGGRLINKRQYKGELSFVYCASVSILLI